MPNRASLPAAVAIRSKAIISSHYQEITLSDLPIRIPNSTLHDIASSFLSPDVSQDSVIELVITVEDININARELAAYLSLDLLRKSV